MIDIAKWITALVTSLTCGLSFYKYYHRRKQNKKILHMILNNVHDKFYRERIILEKVFAYENPNTPLCDILRPYVNDLHFDEKDILEAIRYEEICRNNLSEINMRIIHNYIRSMSYFFNLIRTLTLRENENKSLVEYKDEMKNALGSYQCEIFQLDKTEPFDIIYRKCFDKISEGWKTVEKILR